MLYTWAIKGKTAKWHSFLFGRKLGEIQVVTKEVVFARK